MFAFKQSTTFMARNSGEITEIVVGLLIIFFSLYDAYTRRKKNTVWGIPTWLLGGLILTIGIVFYLYKNPLV